MNKLAEKISDSELKVMRVLWSAGHALPVMEIRRSICKETGWESTTAKTLLYRLQSKGVVAQEKHGIYYYRPLVTEVEYNEFTTQRLIDRLYKGSAKNLVASLVTARKLSAKDLTELEAVLHRGEEDE